MVGMKNRFVYCFVSRPLNRTIKNRNETGKETQTLDISVG